MPRVLFIFNTVNNQRLSHILAIAPIVITLLVAWSLVYHYGYYLEVTKNLVTELPLEQGLAALEHAGPPPEGIEVRIIQDKMIITSPLPSEYKTHVEFTPWYLAARQVNIMTYDILSPLVNPKTFMLSLEHNLVFVDLILAGFGIVHDWKNKKQNKPTILSVYKIYIINIKIQTTAILRKLNNS